MRESIESRIEKTVAGQTIIKSSDGVIVRRKKGTTAQSVLTDNKYKRTRENMANFGLAAKCRKTFRESMGAALANINDKSMHTRLSKTMNAVLKADAISKRGELDILNGNLDLLKGFQFNKKSPLSSSLLAPFTATIDRVTGEAKVVIPAFIADKLVFGPQGATHFVMHMAASAVDFAGDQSDTRIAEGQNIAIDANIAEDTVLTVQLPAGSEHPMFIAFGIYFVQVLHGVPYMLSDGAYNALAVVAVSKA